VTKLYLPAETISKYVNRLPSNLRPNTRECVHLVTRGHFRSCDKDGGHTIRSAVSKNPMVHANSMALCFIEPELFRPFCFCDLDLDLATFIYELDSYSLEIYRLCKYELRTSRLSKVIVWQTNGQIRPKLYTTPMRGLA